MRRKIVSIMSFETQNSAGGSREARTRVISPRTTTVRPDSHTKRRTAGTLRSAENRSRHPPRNSGFSPMTDPPWTPSAVGSSSALDASEVSVEVARILQVLPNQFQANQAQLVKRRLDEKARSE